MSATEVLSSDAPASAPGVATVDLKLEVVTIPVSDVDRAKEFYGRLGWRLDADFPFDNGFRVVQFTPPGSGCSVQFGTNITSAAPGSAQGLYLIVSDVEAFFVDLRARNGLLPVSSPGPFRLPQMMRRRTSRLTFHHFPPKCLWWSKSVARGFVSPLPYIIDSIRFFDSTPLPYRRQRPCRSA